MTPPGLERVQSRKEVPSDSGISSRQQKADLQAVEGGGDPESRYLNTNILWVIRWRLAHAACQCMPQPRLDFGVPASSLSQEDRQIEKTSGGEGAQVQSSQVLW